MRKIILASTSTKRHDLLQQIGLKVEAVPSKYEENMKLKLSPEKLAMKLAEGKAREVASRRKGIIIGVDTFVVYKKKKLGKPKDKKDAFKTLKLFSGKTLKIFSGIYIIDNENNKKVVDYEVTKIRLKKLTNKEIEDYVNTGEPLGKAGSIAIQELGAIFVEKINGCYYNIVGLPLHNLYKNLQKFGINILKD